MIELIFTNGPLTGVRFAIESDNISIGRLNECDIELNQPNISRRHAFIKRAGEKLQIIDNNSGNGVYVNGKRVKNASLKSGDEIRIGANTLRVDVNAAKLTGQEIEVAQVKSAAKATRVQKLTRFIVSDSISATQPTREFSSENLTIGRGEKCRLILDDPEASRLHATIQHRDGSFTIKDAGSANGTLVNGTRIIEAPVNSGDTIEIGNAILTAEISSGILKLTVTRRDGSGADGASSLNQTVTTRPSHLSQTPGKAAGGSEARPASPAASQRLPAVPSYPIIRVLVIVMAVALLLLFVGKNYAATPTQGW